MFVDGGLRGWGVAGEPARVALDVEDAGRASAHQPACVQEEQDVIDDVGTKTALAGCGMVVRDCPWGVVRCYRCIDFVVFSSFKLCTPCTRAH